MKMREHEYASPYVFKERRSVADNLRIEIMADKHNIPIWKVEKLLEDSNLNKKGENNEH